MRWWAVGLSVMATQISAITFVGHHRAGLHRRHALPGRVLRPALRDGDPVRDPRALLLPGARLHRLRVPGEAVRRPHAHPHQPALPVLARDGGGGDALRAVAGAVRDPRAGRDRDHRCSWAGRTIVYVHLRRQQVRDLDRRRADGDHLVRHLPVPRDRHRAAARGDVGLRDALALAQANGRLRIMDTVHRASPRPTRCGAGSSAASSSCCRTSAATRARCSATCRAAASPRAGSRCSSTRSSRCRCSSSSCSPACWSSSSTTSTPEPLLWNAVEMRRLEAQAAPAAEIAALQARFERARRTPRAAQACRATYVADRRRRRARAIPRERPRALDAARKEARAERREARGAEPLQRHQLHLPVLHPRPTCRAASPASSSPSSSRPRCPRSPASSTRWPPRAWWTSTSGFVRPDGRRRPRPADVAGVHRLLGRSSPA